MKKTVLITGATGKLGKAISLHLASLGWNLVLTSRDIYRCKSLAENLSHYDVDVYCLALDLLVAEDVENIALNLHNMGIKLTHLVSNARSIDTLAVDKNGTSLEKPFLNELSIDVVAPYRMIMALAKSEFHDLNSIVSIGSQYGIVAPNASLYNGSLESSPIQYGVAKAALHHMTRELAVRLAPRIRVNSIAFGGFEGRVKPSFKKQYEKMVPSKRMLVELDAGGPVAFLLDCTVSKAITGHVLVADGGWSIW